MKNSLIKLVGAVSLFALSNIANAGLLVEQYDDYYSNDVNSLIAYADANEASASAVWGEIDFTDDPNGFVGDMAGSNRWPSAEQANVVGKNHALNQTFFAKITGNFNVKAADEFFFRTFNDDGLFLFIDGQLIINDNTYHPEKKYEGSINLTAGMHDIELYFFENGGEASLEFTVAGSDKNYTHFDAVDSAVTLVPEPTSLAVFALGLFGLAARRARK